MGEENNRLEEIFSEVQALKDLFLRRLVEDKVKAAAIEQMSANNERLAQLINDMHFVSIIKELFLICDRIEANRSADDFDLSVRDELLEVFSRRGISPISVDTAFNPAVHNVVSTVPAGEGTPPGSIVAVRRTGYCQGEKVLRPADVIIATG